MSALDDLVLDKLVDLLEEGGLKIFKGETKLTLPVCVLQRINAALQQNDSSTEPIPERLHFLQEFVRRTPKLKVTRSKGLTATVDITRFVNVRYLEMDQIPIHLVKGLQALRPQLEALVCHGCSANYEGRSATDEANTSDSLFQWLPGRDSGGFQCLVEDSGSNSLDIEESVPVWEDLRTVSFSNNDLEMVSPRMFRGTPWLQYLDLSNNRITNKWCLESLDHLRHINLSYNHLESLPALSEVASRRLDVLILRNNLIDDLAEIWLYKNLRRLDVSHNLLDNFRTFAALRELDNLLQLDLEGNPISYVTSYRLHTCTNLIRNEFTSKLLLDGKPLNKKEREMLGEIIKYGGFPIRSRTLRRPPPTSEELINADLSTASPSRRLGEPSSVSKSVSSKKIPKVRVAVITDADSVEVEDRQIRDQNTTRTEIQTEKQSDSFNIEEYRQGFRSFVQQMAENEETLQSIYGSSIQGLHNTPCAISAEMGGESPFNLGPNLLNTTGSDLYYSPAVGSADQSSKDYGLCVSPINTTYESLIDAESNDPSNGNATKMRDPNPTKLRLDTSESASSDRTVKQEQSDAEEKQCNPESDLDSEDEKEEANGNNPLWLVQKVTSDGKKEEIFLMLTERELKEKGTVSGRLLVKWALSTVLSCVKVSSEPPTIQLTFDTIRRNCTERNYEMEQDDAQVLLQRIGNVLESRPLKEMNQLVFRCMKCSAVFSHELKATIHNDNSRRCLTCGSNLVIQVDDDEHLPSQGKSPSEIGVEPKLSTSPSQCSIASEGEGVVSMAFLAEVHMTNNSQHEDNDSSYSAWSAASLDRSSRESPAGGPSSTNAEKEGSHGTSDIEVISNPSQSSIEILEVQARLNAVGGGSTTPIRKRSSEERQAIVAVPQLVTVPEVQNVGTGLTESSSSGSLTDSICTTYENHAPLSRRLPSQTSVGGGGGAAPPLPEETSAENSPRAATDTTAVPCPQPPSKTDDNEPLKSFHSLPNTNYASILEDLLQNVSSKLEEPKQSDPAEIDETVQYSYDCLTNVDHRIKFFLYQSLFKEEDEDLLLLIRVTICDQKGQRYPGCFVLSNSNCFILKVVGKEAGDDASEFLQKECILSNLKLSKVQALPWFQGASVTFQDCWYLLLTHDVQRTKSFLEAVNDARPSLPEQCIIDSSEKGTSEDSNSKMALAIQHQLLTAPSMQGENDLDAVVRHISLPVTVAVSRDKAPNETISFASFGVTASNIFLLEPEVSWMLASTDVQPSLHRTHLMSNLVDVEISGTCLELHFLDENEGVEEVWKLSYLTTEAVSNILEAIKSPWEALFSVPLQITTG